MRELDAEVAEKVMGWQWWERPDDKDGTLRKVLYPPENSGWRRYNFSETVWLPAQPTTELFSDWDDCCSREDDPFVRGVPFYSTDIAVAMLVLDKFDDEWTICKMGGFDPPDIYDYQVDVTHNCLVFSAVAATLPEAICRAALRAAEQGEVVEL